MNLTEFAQVAGIVTAGALVTSVCMVAYNLMETRRDARRNLSFSLMERLTASDFAARRWKMRQTVERAVQRNWEGFDDTPDDFETRAFAYQYELIGQMVRKKTLEYAAMRDFLQFTIVSDWNAFAPLDDHLARRYGRPSPWDRFRALAERITVDLKGPPLTPRG